jgi:hypothetical protein
MNHIARLIHERDAAWAQIRAARERLDEIEHYLTSAQFPDDFVHVRTDILPKIANVRFGLISSEPLT